MRFWVIWWYLFGYQSVLPIKSSLTDIDIVFSELQMRLSIIPHFGLMGSVAIWEIHTWLFDGDFRDRVLLLKSDLSPKLNMNKEELSLT